MDGKERLSSRASRVLGENTVRMRYCENSLLDLSSVVHSVQVRGNMIEVSKYVGTPGNRVSCHMI